MTREDQLAARMVDRQARLVRVASLYKQRQGRGKAGALIRKADFRVILKELGVEATDAEADVRPRQLR